MHGAGCRGSCRPGGLCFCRAPFPLPAPSGKVIMGKWRKTALGDQRRGRHTVNRDQGARVGCVVNSTPLTSHLWTQKTFSRAVKFDIFKGPGTVVQSTHQKPTTAHLFHGGGTLAPHGSLRNVKCISPAFFPTLFSCVTGLRSNQLTNTKAPQCRRKVQVRPLLPGSGWPSMPSAPTPRTGPEAWGRRHIHHLLGPVCD